MIKYISLKLIRGNVANPKISIILPVYNVEKWLHRAAKSLGEQTFADFEAWLVDDGSKDNSGKICDEIAQMDARFKVIHQENAGAAAARNAAIPKASGKYLYFMDPDDWAEKDMLQDMYVFAEKNNLELVVAGFYIDTYYKDEKFYQEMRTAPDIVYKSQNDFRANSHDLFDRQLLYAPWNKLYLREYLINNKICFPSTFWDDLPFNLDVIKDIKKVGCINKRYYHFLRARQEAENTKYRPDMYDKREEENTWLHELYKYWNINNPDVEEFLARRYSERLIGCVENLTCKNCKLSKGEKLAQIKKMISTPHAIDSFKKTKPKSKMMALMLKPLKKQNAKLTLKEGQFISFVKQNSTNIFARLKANR